jgi:hypothetical protein
MGYPITPAVTAELSGRAPGVIFGTEFARHEPGSRSMTHKGTHIRDWDPFARSRQEALRVARDPAYIEAILRHDGREAGAYMLLRAELSRQAARQRYLDDLYHDVERVVAWERAAEAMVLDRCDALVDGEWDLFAMAVDAELMDLQPVGQDWGVEWTVDGVDDPVVHVIASRATDLIEGYEADLRYLALSLYRVDGALVLTVDRPGSVIRIRPGIPEAAASTVDTRATAEPWQRGDDAAF